jgi:hypothetical protein
VSDLPPPPPTRMPSPPSRRRRTWRWLVPVVGVLIVAGAATAGLLQDGGEGVTVSGSAPSPGAVSPDAPAKLRAQPGAFQVKLAWQPGSGDGAEVDRYDIQRNDEVVGHVTASATSWVDEYVVPGEQYVYQVVAISAEGRRSRSSIDVTAKEAPPGTASLVGTFTVRVHVTSHTGFATFGHERYDSGWRFQPVCDRPPCDTQLRDIHNTEFTMTLDQSEGTYTGSGSATFGTCNGHRVPSTFTVTLHVAEAGDVRGVWQATKFSGTMSQSATAQLGCTSTSTRFELVGTALKR